ncbi:MAG TPA: CerR family C-terminal domain-containing protein [Burkholderiaceae bacterium]|nr:CerR family C-terminal domain-containing protein [Burkholderiaceae bacterium]
MLYDITLEPVASPRAQRSDGSQARERLLHAALKLFADKGYAKASTREIALAAGTNIAAISYYFGDKAGLYRATFTEPLGSPQNDIARYNQPHLSLKASLQGYFSSFVEPIKQGELVQQCLRLHLREMLDPTSQWAEELDKDVKQPHAALVSVLCRHLGLVQADDDVHRLAFAIAGLAVQLFVSREVIDDVRPSLTASAPAIDVWTARLVGYACALVQSESDRRSQAASPAGAANGKTPTRTKGISA